MSGKISGVTNSQTASAATSSAGARAATSPAATQNAGPAAGSTSATDSVRITDTASHLVTAEQALNAVPVVNRDRVSQVSESLNAGTYRVSPERIANQLLQFEQLLPEESV